MSDRNRTDGDDAYLSRAGGRRSRGAGVGRQREMVGRRRCGTFIDSSCRGEPVERWCSGGQPTEDLTISGSHGKSQDATPKIPGCSLRPKVTEHAVSKGCRSPRAACDRRSRNTPPCNTPVRDAAAVRAQSATAVACAVAISPTVRRRRLLRELQRLRFDSGKTIDEAAEHVGMSKSTLSRVENGQVGLKTLMLRALLEFYSATEEQSQALMQLHREASRRGWWQDADAPINEYYRLLAGLEDEASRVRVFQQALVPGLLQTPEYSAAIATMYDPDLSQDMLRAGLEFRRRRQQRIGEFDLEVILTEETLLRQVGGRDVMKEQLRHLSEVARRPKVTLRVISLAAGAHAGIAGSFTILGFADPSDPEVVYLEGAAGERYIEDIEMIRQFSQKFDRLTGSALGTRESSRIFTHLRERLSA